MFTCARCGEPVTVPYKHEGKVYGYTCIDIVNPSRNSKDTFVPVAFVKHTVKEFESGTFHNFKLPAGFAGFVCFSFGPREIDSFHFENDSLFVFKSLVKKYRLHKQK